MLITQLCPTLCNPMDCSPPGSSGHGIFQARIPERVAIPFSRGTSWPRDRTRSPSLRADSLPSEPPGKPYSMSNTVLGSGIQWLVSQKPGPQGAHNCICIHQDSRGQKHPVGGNTEAVKYKICKLFNYPLNNPMHYLCIHICKCVF